MSTPQNGPRRRREKARRAKQLARWRWSLDRLTSDAVDWALSRYNDDLAFRQITVEIGNVLSAKRASGALRPGPDVRGPNGGQVSPYAGTGLMRVIESMAGDGDVYLGDYHSHVGSGLSWTDHVPSPADVARDSCLCDLWPVSGIPGLPGLPIAPRFQLMQASLFGDIFLITPAPVRPVFATVQQQATAMAAIEQAYGLWHLQALHAHGGLDGLAFPLRHAEFVATAREELAAMNATLNKRGKIAFVENARYVSDDDDFLA